MVDVQRLQGNWNQIRGEIRKRWEQLTDDDLGSFEGDLDALTGRIQEKTGESREAIEHQLDELTSDGSSAVGRAAETARQAAADAAESAGEYARQAAQAAAAAPKFMADKLGSGYAEAEEIVRRRPAESLAVVFGTGLLAGVVLGLVVRSK